MTDLGIYRTLGSNLIYQGKLFLNKATPVKKTRYTATALKNAISAATGISAIYSADTYHDTTDIDTWKLIIEGEWSNKKIWVAETFDCDNFAGVFSNFAPDVYGLNSVGRITVALYDPISGKPIKDLVTGQDAYHRACIIVDDYLQCWLLETQTDEFVKIVAGKFPVIRNWEYRFINFDIN